MADDESVVALYGEGVPELGEPQQDLIKELEAVLDLARRGEVVGGGIALLHSNRLSSSRVAGLTGTYSLVGAAQIVLKRLTEDADS